MEEATADTVAIPGRGAGFVNAHNSCCRSNDKRRHANYEARRKTLKVKPLNPELQGERRPEYQGALILPLW